MDRSLKSRFAALTKEWKGEAMFLSSVDAIVAIPAYQRIVEMGKPAIPLILDELKREPDHWFPALYAITGESPVAEADRGVISKMAQSWIEGGAC